MEFRKGNRHVGSDNDIQSPTILKPIRLVSEYKHNKAGTSPSSYSFDIARTSVYSGLYFSNFHLRSMGLGRGSCRRLVLAALGFRSLLS